MWTLLRDHLEAEGHGRSVLDRYLPEHELRKPGSRLLPTDVTAVRPAVGQLDRQPGRWRSVRRAEPAWDP